MTVLNVSANGREAAEEETEDETETCDMLLSIEKN